MSLAAVPVCLPKRSSKHYRYPICNHKSREAGFKETAESSRGRAATVEPQAMRPPKGGDKFQERKAEQRGIVADPTAQFSRARSHATLTVLGSARRPSTTFLKVNTAVSVHREVVGTPLRSWRLRKMLGGVSAGSRVAPYAEDSSRAELRLCV